MASRLEIMMHKWIFRSLASFSCSVLLTLHSTAAPAETLLQVFQDALYNDPTFRSAEAQWEAARQDIPIALSALLPQITSNFSLNDNHTHSNVNNHVILAGTGSFSSQVTAISATAPIFNANLWAQLQGSNDTVKSATATYSAAFQNLIIRTVQAYVNVMLAYEAIRYTLANEQATYNQLVTQQQKFKVGLVAITDVYDAQAQYDAIVAQEIVNRNQLDDNLEQLQAITGKYYLKLSGLGKKGVPMYPPEPANINSWVQVARKQNYQLLAQQFGTKAAYANVLANAANHLPTIEMQASYQRTDNDNSPGSIAASLNNRHGVADTHTENSTVGVSINLPIYSGGGIVARTEQARAEYANQAAILEFTHRQVVTQTREAYLGVVSAISQIKAQVLAIKSAANSVITTQEAYKVGTRTMVDVLQALTQLFSAQQLLANDEYQYVNNFVALKNQAGTLSIEDLRTVDTWLTNTVDFTGTYAPTRLRMENGTFSYNYEHHEIPEEEKGLASINISDVGGVQQAISAPPPGIGNTQLPTANVAPSTTTNPPPGGPTALPAAPSLPSITPPIPTTPEINIPNLPSAPTLPGNPANLTTPPTPGANPSLPPAPTLNTPASTNSTSPLPSPEQLGVPSTTQPQSPGTAPTTAPSLEQTITPSNPSGSENNSSSNSNNSQTRANSQTLQPAAASTNQNQATTVKTLDGSTLPSPTLLTPLPESAATATTANQEPPQQPATQVGLSSSAAVSKANSDHATIKSPTEISQSQSLTPTTLKLNKAEAKPEQPVSSIKTTAESTSVTPGESSKATRYFDLLKQKAKQYISTLTTQVKQTTHNLVHNKSTHTNNQAAPAATAKPATATIEKTKDTSKIKSAPTTKKSTSQQNTSSSAAHKTHKKTTATHVSKPGSTKHTSKTQHSPQHHPNNTAPQSTEAKKPVVANARPAIHSKLSTKTTNEAPSRPTLPKPTLTVQAAAKPAKQHLASLAVPKATTTKKLPPKNSIIGTHTELSSQTLHQEQPPTEQPKASLPKPKLTQHQLLSIATPKATMTKPAKAEPRVRTTTATPIDHPELSAATLPKPIQSIQTQTNLPRPQLTTTEASATQPEGHASLPIPGSHSQ